MNTTEMIDKKSDRRRSA